VSTRKHVNLDMDVHLKLKKRRKQTGLTIKQTANSLLRCALNQRQLLYDVVGERLVESGRVTRDEYSEIVAETLDEIRERAAQGHDLLIPRPDGTYVAAGWRFEPLHADPEGSFQIVHARVVDARKRVAPVHVHPVDEVITVVSGHIIVHSESSCTTLDESGCVRIPAGDAHSTTPLTPNTAVLLLFVPAGDCLI
jgi:mannose-6-phosphate isomerase-like protein (cupin superfamily)